VTPNYLGLRNAHFRITLKAWFRGLDQAVVAIVAVLQFILTAVVIMAVVGLARALALLASPASSWEVRAAVVCGWLAVSHILLRSVREAAFMPRARAFFDNLPVAPAHKLRADLLLAALSYSFLWLPVGWVLADPLGASPVTASTVTAVLGLVAISLCTNIALLRGARRPAAAALAALLAFAVIGGDGAAAQFARAGCAAVAALALWKSYLPDRSRMTTAPRPHPLWERLALGSGLVTVLLTNELRSNLLIRAGAILATLGGCLAVMQLRTNDVSSASVVVFVAAVAAVALYSLPALCRNTLLSHLGFLAGQPAFARRMRFAAYAIPVVLFTLSIACAWPFDRSGRAWTDAGVFTILFVLGVAGARLGWRPVSWLMPFFTMLGLIILAAMT
jgi:uncharacterized protein DUF6136